MARAAVADLRERERRRIAGLLDEFQYHYRDLEELATMIGVFSRRFHVTHDVVQAAVDEDEHYATRAITEVILPFEFFELLFDDTSTVSPVQVERLGSMQFERISFGRIYAERDIRADDDDYAITWAALCVAQVRINEHPYRIAHAITPMTHDGRTGAPPFNILAASGVLNRPSPDPEGAAGEKIRSYTCSTDVVAFVPWYAQSILAKFSELLNHKSVSVLRDANEVRTRAERRNLARLLDIETAAVPEPPPHYRIVIRDRATVGSLCRDISSHRHIRYTPKRRHVVAEHLREYHPGKYTTVSGHQRGGGTGPGADYLLARDMLLRGLGVDDADASPGR